VAPRRFPDAIRLAKDEVLDAIATLLSVEAQLIEQGDMHLAFDLREKVLMVLEARLLEEGHLPEAEAPPGA
jgi:hypothetical protein